MTNTTRALHSSAHAWALRAGKVLASALALTMLTAVNVPQAIAEETSDQSQVAVPVDADTPPNPTHMWSGPTEDDAESTRSEDATSRAFTDRPNWEDQNGRRVVRMVNGTVFSNDAMKVIDVSEHQSYINWNNVARSGVDGAILRIGYGSNNLDKRFIENLKGVRSIGMPYGVYLYSYAYDANFARNEANSLANMLQRYGVNDNMLPIFYDLERWEWTGHTCPSTPRQYKPIVDTFFDTMAARGYTNVQVYSYKSYLETALNDPTIRSKAGWVAQYNRNFDYDFSRTSYNGARGWQYTDIGTVWGINGPVDASAFDRLLFSDVNSRTTPHFYDIEWIVKKGITKGYPDKSYRGTSNVIRQDMAAFMYRSLRSPNFTPTNAQRNRFTDVNGSTPFANEIWWLAAKGITTGYADGKFLPSSAIIRQDMAAFLYRLAGSPKYEPSAQDKVRFKDVNESTPHAKEIWWCASVGIAHGFSDGSYQPTATVNRQDMGAFLNRTTGLMGM
ncbi:glycosyl hydrolase family 25 [Bifidobacterium dolichotidis]|uniref:Glycosyl hydrolase family 25 n=1 Tax=Bifidobacterium dolichotidis TaxID=2306976 RepID=A0A430FKC5_9BIFI|nr:S-layer homology domain-containing protein [Bifidobacterium dolichotidis]RSX53339.1 glycosyl hydrolase family 25 [Bifidobacterium dolichotidis]